MYNRGKVQSSPHRRSLALLEPQGTGRLSFAILSSFTGNKYDISVPKRRKNFTWVDLLPEVLETIDVGIIQPKFSYSRTLMLLRDSILQTQTTSFIMLIADCEIVSESTIMWLELAEHLGMKNRCNILNGRYENQVKDERKFSEEAIRDNKMVDKESTAEHKKDLIFENDEGEEFMNILVEFP